MLGLPKSKIDIHSAGSFVKRGGVTSSRAAKISFRYPDEVAPYIPRISPPGWHVRQKFVIFPPAEISETFPPRPESVTRSTIRPPNRA